MNLLGELIASGIAVGAIYGLEESGDATGNTHG